MKKEERITLRVSEKEKMHLAMQAYFAGISVSELIRKKIKGVEVVPKVDKMVLNEIRRQGGLLKNNFNTIKNGDLTSAEKEQLIAHHARVLNAMNELVDSIRTSYSTE